MGFADARGGVALSTLPLAVLFLLIEEESGFSTTITSTGTGDKEVIIPSSLSPRPHKFIQVGKIPIKLPREVPRRMGVSKEKKTMMSMEAPEADSCWGVLHRM